MVTYLFKQAKRSNW